MALELLAWFNGDARTLSFTSYTYARGFANAHRRFAQAFLALPAIDGLRIETSDPEVCIRCYPSSEAVYVGVASKAASDKIIRVAIPAEELTGICRAAVTDQVTGMKVPAKYGNGQLCFEVESGPMELHAFRICEATNNKIK